MTLINSLCLRHSLTYSDDGDKLTTFTSSNGPILMTLINSLCLCHSWAYSDDGDKLTMLTSSIGPILMM